MVRPERLLSDRQQLLCQRYRLGVFSRPIKLDYSLVEFDGFARLRTHWGGQAECQHKSGHDNQAKISNRIHPTELLPRTMMTAGSRQFRAEVSLKKSRNFNRWNRHRRSN